MAKKNNNSSFVAEALKKFFNHYIVKNLIILSFTGFFILYGTLLFLRYYTHHGEAITVPDVTGMSLLEAEITLELHKMRWQLSDSVYVGTARPGVVVNQNPEAGSKVKENRNIFIIINAFAPEKVIMPDVVGVSHRQAISTLESRGLSIGRITYKPDRYRDYVRKQFYQGQEIRRGTEIMKGSEIDLELGSGLSEQRTSVPFLLGNTLSAANRILTQYELNLGVPIYDNTVVTSADSVNAFIYQQSPAAAIGATLQLGAAINVWLSIDETKKTEMQQE